MIKYKVWVQLSLFYILETLGTTTNLQLNEINEQGL